MVEQIVEVQERQLAFTAMAELVAGQGVLRMCRVLAMAEQDTLDEYGFMDNIWNII
jgi:hypothetical protein